MTESKKCSPSAADFQLRDMLKNFSLIYGTETAFDHVRRGILSLSALRAAASPDNHNIWLRSSARRTVLPEQVVFDPTGKSDPATTCNLWGGWPTTPKAGNCKLILELLEYLCSGEDNPREVFTWVLKWKAYPIQHPGAKMQTALLIHGTEGVGKNLAFGALRAIYERYGGSFGQTELESQFNGFASGKLFMVGNEVVNRAEKYHQQGRIKTMITETEWQINEKNLPRRLEANHCNFVFFSNRIDIAQLDPDDRRFCVIWTPASLSEKFYKDVADELRNGGVAALHHYLLHLDLGDFGPHTKPPLTRSKRELIALSLDSTERFFMAWRAGHIEVPFAPCRSEDLYAAYRLWTQAIGVLRAAPEYTMLATIGKKPGITKERAWHYKPGTSIKTRSTVVIPPGFTPAEGQTSIAWITEKIAKFAEALTAMKESKP